MIDFQKHIKDNPVISFISKHPWLCFGATIYVVLLIFCSIKGNFDCYGIFTFAFFSIFPIIIILFCIYVLFNDDDKKTGIKEWLSYAWFPILVIISSCLFLLSCYFNISEESKKRIEEKEENKINKVQSQTESNYNYYETIFVPLEDCFSDNGKSAYYPVYTTTTGEKYHLGDCKYLRDSKYGTQLYNAIAEGYTPCSECNPPLLHSRYKEDFGL